MLLANYSYSVAEHAIGIIVGCMPLFPALYRKLRFARLPSNAPSNSSPSSHHRKPALYSSRRKHRNLGSESDLVWAGQRHAAEPSADGGVEIELVDSQEQSLERERDKTQSGLSYNEVFELERV